MHGRQSQGEAAKITNKAQCTKHTVDYVEHMCGLRTCSIEGLLPGDCSLVRVPTCRLLGNGEAASFSVHNKSDITCDAGA